MIEYCILKDVSDSDVEDIRLLKEALTPGTGAKVTRAFVEDTCKHGFLVVALDASLGRRSIVGMTTLFLTPKVDGLTGIVDQVVRHPSYQKRGIGDGLMARIHELALEHGASQLKLTSRPHREAAHQLYLKLGYTRVDTNVFVIDLSKS